MGDEMMADETITDEELEIGSEPTRWSPPEGVVRHAGGPVKAEWDFFAEPPPEIGELVSAETTMKAGAKPWRLASRIALAGLIAWGGYMAAQVVNFGNRPDDEFRIKVAIVIVALVGAIIAWYLTRFSHTCSFVGKLGLARFKCKGSRDKVRAPEVFLFQDAAELRTSQTRHYHNGIYTGTNYAFTWTNNEGKKAFKLSSTYRGENKPPKETDPFHYATMAEGAWSAFLFDQVVATLNAAGAVRFNLSGKYFVAIGPGFLDVYTGGTEVIHLTAEEIGGMQIDSGQVKIKRIDAKEGWFSSTGVYKFGYENMANSRLFLLLYAHLVGR